MKNIVISESGFSLPPESITSTFAILAKRGAGKSNTAAVMAEEFFKCGLPFVVIDPVGAWWGLRAGQDGKPEGGLPIPIFGGEHGDLPLERTGGELIADLVISKRLSCVLDLSGFDSEAAKRQFLLGFALRIYRKNRNPLHLFLEEADDYIPQKPQKGDLALLGAMERLVRQGRAKCGIGVTMITQRSAAINKGVLTQTDTLIVLRTTGPHDQAAIKEWVKYHQVDNSIISTLSELKNGEAWIWSPEFLEKTVRVQILRRRTFDSGATPKNIHANEAQKAATLADINLGELRERMAASVEAFKENDPKELKKRIADLERELRKKAPAAPIDERQLDEARAIGRQRGQELGESIGYGTGYKDGVRKGLMASSEALSNVDIDALCAEVTAASEDARNIPKNLTVPRQASIEQAGGEGRTARPSPGLNGNMKPGSGFARMLGVLASRYPARLTRAQLGTLAKVKHTGGTFGTYLSKLKGAGWIAEDGQGYLTATDDGIAAAGVDIQVPETAEEVREMWKSSLGGKPSMMIDVLYERGPLLRQDLAAAVELEASAGTFGTYLSKLSANHLIVKEGSMVRLSEELA